MHFLLKYPSHFRVELPHHPHRRHLCDHPPIPSTFPGIATNHPTSLPGTQLQRCFENCAAMAAPNDGYGQFPPQQQFEQDQQQYPDVAAAGSPPPAQNQQPGDAGKKKKRGYATQAYEFGAGGNAAAGAPVAGGMMPGQSAPGASPMGYPAQQDFQAGYGGAPAPAGYAVPPAGTPTQPGLGGYQAPDAYYQGAAVPGTPQGMGGITAGMQNMNMGGQPAQAQPPQQQARVALNQLYPTDLLNQPFNVSELDLPPPPCILPPNVSPCSAPYHQHGTLT